MKIAICDDDTDFTKELYNRIYDYFINHNIEPTIDIFDNGQNLIARNKIYDLIIMDYKMEHLNGIQTVAELRKGVNSFTHIIFLTLYPEIAISAYEVDTYRFVVKNTLYHSLYSAFDDYRKIINLDKNIRLCSNRGYTTISTEELMYIESHNKTVMLFLADGTQICTYKKLSEILQELPSAYFSQIHKSFVVNMRFISFYSSAEIKISDLFLPVSKKYAKSFKNKYTIFLRDTR